MTINRAFVEVFEETMEAAGFARKGKVFHRIVNGQIVQLLSYTKFSGPDFTIQFSIYPLYLGFEWSTSMDDSRLSELFPDMPQSWVYGWKTDEYIQIMPRALEKTKEKLFPLFETLIDDESYMEHAKLKHSFEPKEFSNFAFKQRLIQGDYEGAKRSRESLFDYWKEIYQKNWGIDYHIVPQRQEENEATKREYERLKVAMDAREEDVIKAYICEERKKSLDSYVQAFTTPKKYEKYKETSLLPFEFVPLEKNETRINAAYQNYNDAQVFKQQQAKIRNALGRLPYNRNPNGYKEKGCVPINGVKYFGFSETSDELYIDSTSGRILVSLSKYQTTALDENTNDDLNDQQLTANGFDVLEGQQIKLACKYGKSLLPVANKRGDKLLCGSPYYDLIFQPAGDDCFVQEGDYSKVISNRSCRIIDGDFYGYGFSFSGKYFVVACEDGIWFWEAC